MFKRIFKFSTVRSILGSRIFDNYYSDFIMGYCFLKKQMPASISLIKSLHTIKIDEVKDLFTINEIFNWKIYKTPRWSEYKNIVDIGANIGCASIFLCELVDVKRLVAIEPNAKVIETLKYNIKKNIKGVDIEIIEAAIAKTSGAQDFFVSDSSRYSALIKSASFNYIEKTSVDCIDFETLLTYFSKMEPNSTLIKIDIEGVEKDFFSYLEKQDEYIGDIVVEGEDLPSEFGAYVCQTKKFKDVYYYTKK